MTDPRRRITGPRLQALTACALLAPVLALAAPGADYDALITRARAGDYEPALAMLRQQGAAAGRQAVYDHIVIASWAGRPAEAVAAYETLSPSLALPADIQLAVARAYRDLRRWPEALSAYRAGLRRHPDQSAFAAGEIMTLADAGQTEAALAAGRAWSRRAPRDADARLALSYVHVRLRQPYEALHQADQALAIAPGTPYVLREYIAALSRARLAQPALD
ncbi:poly-beta-1,6 N-acetyl-D-glucosamine export porin PgaA, partial [Achromobacter xylosoxidans]